MYQRLRRREEPRGVSACVLRGEVGGRGRGGLVFLTAGWWGCIHYRLWTLQTATLCIKKKQYNNEGSSCYRATVEVEVL